MYLVLTNNYNHPDGKGGFQLDALSPLAFMRNGEKNEASWKLFSFIGSLATGMVGSLTKQLIQHQSLQK